MAFFLFFLFIHIKKKFSITRVFCKNMKRVNHLPRSQLAELWRFSGIPDQRCFYRPFPARLSPKHRKRLFNSFLFYLFVFFFSLLVFLRMPANVRDDCFPCSRSYAGVQNACLFLFFVLFVSPTVNLPCFPACLFVCLSTCLPACLFVSLPLSKLAERHYVKLLAAKLPLMSNDSPSCNRQDGD